IQKSATPGSKLPREIVVAMIGLLGIIVTALAPLIMEKLRTKPNGNTEIKIKRPLDGGLVNSQEMIRGESRNIPAGHQIWVAVYSDSDRVYYPHNQNAGTDAKGNWESPEVNIGASTD
ncbi:MAG: hypothetical protein ACRD2L_17065, partial [Terriglobia bacterium]